MAICSATSYPFGFSYKRKILSLDILNCFVTKLSNQGNRVSFLQVGRYVSLALFSEFIRACHNMNIIVQTTGGDASSINGKTEIPTNTLANTTRDLLMK